MKIHQDREFTSIYDRNSGKTFSDLEFHRCRFVSCSVSITRDSRRRSKVRNVRFINCEQLGCSLHAGIVEDVIVDGFKTNGLFQTWGAVFKHVIIRGKVGRIMISPLISGVATGSLPPDHQKPFAEANEFYYSNVDWAMDISEAQFEEADLRGVPGNLILRDVNTQFIITREKALRGEWKNVDLSGTYWRTAIEFFLETGFEDQVLVAPKRHPKFRVYLDGLLKLRDIGVLEET